MKPTGWRYESARHALAAKGVATGRRYNLSLGDINKFAESRGGGWGNVGATYKSIFTGGRVALTPEAQTFVKNVAKDQAKRIGNAGAVTGAVIANPLSPGIRLSPGAESAVRSFARDQAARLQNAGAVTGSVVMNPLNPNIQLSPGATSAVRAFAKDQAERLQNVRDTYKAAFAGQSFKQVRKLPEFNFTERWGDKLSLSPEGVLLRNREVVPKMVTVPQVMPPPKIYPVTEKIIPHEIIRPAEIAPIQAPVGVLPFRSFEPPKSWTGALKETKSWTGGERVRPSWVITENPEGTTTVAQRSWTGGTRKVGTFGTAPMTRENLNRLVPNSESNAEYMRPFIEVAMR